MKKVLFIGGTRFIGPLVIRRLISQGHEVSVFSRGNQYSAFLSGEVKHIKGDRHNLQDFNKLFNEHYDYVFDMCCYNPVEARDLIKASQSNFQHLIFFSTAAVYKKPITLPLDEKNSLGVWDSFGDYGLNKAKAERIFSQNAEKNGTKLTIFRPTYILGKDNYFDRENYYFSRLLKHRPILVPGNGKALQQFCNSEDVAHAFSIVPFSQADQIEILNVGGDEYTSITGFIEQCSQIVGVKPKIIGINCKEFNLDEDHFYDNLYPFPNVSLLLSNSRIKEKYGITFMKLDQDLARTYKHWKKTWDGKVRTSDTEVKILKEI